MNLPITLPFDHSRHKLSVADLDATLDVLTFEGEESLSQPFKYTVEFTCVQQDIAAEQILGRYATFSLHAAPYKAPLKNSYSSEEAAKEKLKLTHHLIQRFEKGFLLRGVDIEITLDANGFSGEGDISLFGEMLNRFFALYADIHLYNQLTLILQPTGKCLRWNENHSQRIPG